MPRRKLPPGEKKKTISIYVKAKYYKIAIKEVQKIEKYFENYVDNGKKNDFKQI